MDFTYLTFESVPKTLYHYTSLEALVAIVQTKRLRASHMRFLNDKSESLRLKEDVVKILQKRAASNDRDTAKTIIEAIQTMPQQALFVASLSEESDLLSQWRAYCPSGLGVSIGFSSDALIEQFIANPNGGAPFFLSSPLQRVRYYAPTDQGALEAFMDKLLNLEQEVGTLNAVGSILSGESIPSGFLENAIKVVIEVEGKPGFNLPPPPLSGIRAWLAILSPFIKHDAFAEEREWRKVVSKDHRPVPGQRFRQGKSTLIPFVEIMLDVMRVGAECVPRQNYFINEVIVGPTPAPELTVEALNSLFASEGHQEVVVRESRIPFRSW